MKRNRAAVLQRSFFDRLHDAVYTLEPEATVILYGSRARGDAKPDSDWDILVLLDGLIDADRSSSLNNALAALTHQTGEAIQAFVICRDDWNSAFSRATPLHRNIDAEGIQISAKGHIAPPLTEEQMTEATDQVIREWLRRCHEALDDAEYNAADGRWRTAVGRLYYAAYYAVSALLISRGYRFSTHHGVEVLFEQQFGTTGTVPSDFIWLYKALHRDRISADYETTSRFEGDVVRARLQQTQALISLLEGLLFNSDNS